LESFIKERGVQFSMEAKEIDAPVLSGFSPFLCKGMIGAVCRTFRAIPERNAA